MRVRFCPASQMALPAGHRTWVRWNRGGSFRLMARGRFRNNRSLNRLAGRRRSGRAGLSRSPSRHIRASGATTALRRCPSRTTRHPECNPSGPIRSVKKSRSVSERRCVDRSAPLRLTRIFTATLLRPECVGGGRDSRRQQCAKRHSWSQPPRHQRRLLHQW